MTSIISKLLFSLLLFSLISERVVYMATSQEIHCLPLDNEDPEKKSGENKTEKEDEKDKALFVQAVLTRIFYAGVDYDRNNTVITSAYLLLPEIPPDRS